MKTKFMLEKRTPKYFHSDGNGVHLEVNHMYNIEVDNRKILVKVLKEYMYFYLVSVNGKYKMTINKLVNEFKVIND